MYCVSAMSLETHIAGSNDSLIDGLHFGGRNTASYIVERRGTTFHPTSASSFKPSGVRLIRFNLADHSGWLIGDTVRLVFQLTNLSGTTAMTPIVDSPASMFRRMRIIANGSAVVEDIEEYGRCHQLFSTLLPSQRRYNDVAESWGGKNTACTLTAPTSVDDLPADSTRTVLVHLMSSFLSQGKYLPLNMVPLTIELELGDTDDCFSGSGNTWEISRPRLICDACLVDQALQNSYAKHLLDGRSLPIYIKGMYSVKTAIPAATSLFSFPIARGFTRLSAIYCTFYKDGKWANDFHAPLAAQTNIAANDDFEYNITLGSERFPSFNVDSVQEAFYRLRLTQLTHQGTDSFSISPYLYRNSNFVIGQSLEKCPGSASHTGVNTRSGSQLTLNFRNLGQATMMHVVLLYDEIVNVSAAGVEVLD